MQGARHPFGLARPSAAAVVVAALIVGCGQPDPQEQVTIDTGITEPNAVAELERRVGIDLPSALEDIGWVQLEDWDGSDFYVRLVTNPSGVTGLLDKYESSVRDMEPVEGSLDSSKALPRTSRWRDMMPEDVEQWYPQTQSGLRAIEGVRADNPRAVRYFDMLVATIGGRQIEVFIHVAEF